MIQSLIFPNVSAKRDKSVVWDRVSKGIKGARDYIEKGVALKSGQMILNPRGKFLTRSFNLVSFVMLFSPHQAKVCMAGSLGMSRGGRTI